MKVKHTRARAARLGALLLALACLLTPLYGCGGNPGTPGSTVEVPRGMAIVYTEEGLTLMAPESWAAQKLGEVVCLYASSADPTSITAVTVESPLSPADYFAAHEDELRATVAEYTRLTAEESDEAFIGERPAVRRVYTGKRNGTPYKFMQVICRRGDGLFMLTYTAKNEVVRNDKTYFELWFDAATLTVENVIFEGEALPEVTLPAPTPDAEGMILASNPDISRYSLWVPQNYEIELANGITMAKTEGAVISLSYTVPQTENLLQHRDLREAYLNEAYTNVTKIESECAGEKPVEKPEDVELWVAERQAMRVVYTYTHNNVAYKTVKIFTVNGVYIYELSYTARLDAAAGETSPYDAHRAEFDRVIARFAFD